MKARLIAVTLAMVAFAVAFKARPVPPPIVRSEAWLQDVTPTQCDGFTAIPGSNGDRQTYRMSQTTYDTLKAYGIDTQILSNGKSNIDVCVIAGNNRECFHDPQMCFPGQDWRILNTRIVPVETNSRGSIPFAVISTQHGDDPAVYAAYTYKAPYGMVTSQGDLYLQWSKASFLTSAPQEGAFYRFIGDPQMSEKDLLHFAADYMDAIKRQSKGIL